VPTVSPTGRSLASVSAALATGLLGAALMLAGAPGANAAPEHTLLQPAGSTFAVAFPDTPRALTGPTILALFPGALSAVDYALSLAPGHVQALPTGIPPAPSYMVVTAEFPSSEAAEAYISGTAHGKGVTPVLIGDVAGYQFLGREVSPFALGKKDRTPRNKRPFESVVTVAQGDTVYLALAFTRKAGTAQAFTHSLKLLPGSAGAVPTSSGKATSSGSQPTTVKKTNTAYRVGEYAGLALLALLISALVVKYTKKPSGSPTGYPSRPYPTPPPPGAAQAPFQVASSNSQFAWMYPPPPGSPTHGSPPPPPPPIAR
jgi:hypothetical protein